MGANDRNALVIAQHTDILQEMEKEVYKNEKLTKKKRKKGKHVGELSFPLTRDKFASKQNTNIEIVVRREKGPLTFYNLLKKHFFKLN